MNVTLEQLRNRSLYVAVPMYGGKSDFPFMYGMYQTGVKFAHLGIPLQLDVLANESLITRARNYCIQRNMIVETENGPKTIGWVVKNKYRGKVLSWRNNKLEWNNVVNHWERLNTEKKKWVKLTNGIRTRKGLICTEDHKVACVENILNPVISYSPAIDMKGKYAIRLPNDTIFNMSRENKLYNPEQISIIVGSVLGDGTINKNGTFTTSHTDKQKEYILFVQNLLGGTITSKEVTSTFPNGYSHITILHTLTTKTTEQTKLLRELFYVKNKKSIKNILPYLDEIGLAYWYMDDGSLIKPKGKTPYSVLYSMAFPYEEQEILKQWFKDKFDLTVSINKNTDKWILQFSIGETIKFQRLIAKYVPQSMRYKLLDNTDEYYNYNNTYLDISAMKVNDVVYLDEKDSRCGKLYDIEVENANNFFANGTLVHNCVDDFLRSGFSNLLFIDADIGFSPDDIISLLAFADPSSEYDIITGGYPKKVIAWEKILSAAKTGQFDNDPNQLERFVGDLVVNVEGSGTYRLDQPIPVKEAGTGFMLIQRHVFERIAEKYPEYYYRPDHGRTQYFSGNRKIMQYFQAEIDQGYYLDKVYDLVDFVKNNKIDKALELANEIDQKRNSSQLRYLSEDYFFNRIAESVGCKTWILPWIKLSHTGNYVFKSDMQALTSINASLNLDPQAIKKN